MRRRRWGPSLAVGLRLIWLTFSIVACDGALEGVAAQVRRLGGDDELTRLRLRRAGGPARCDGGGGDVGEDRRMIPEPSPARRPVAGPRVTPVVLPLPGRHSVATPGKSCRSTRSQRM
jgi:hypothetical protein